MKKQLWKQSIVRWAVVATLVLSGAGLVSAQERFERQVRDQLNRVKVKLAESDYENTHNYKIDRLGKRATDTFTANLRKGMEYVLVSVCDNDCKDIDLKIYDENDNLIAEDLKEDDLPVVKVTPKWTGEFTIHVVMAKCNASPCYYGIGVFGK